MKKILILAENAWDSPTHVGSHQIAKVFLNMGWRVAYISKPISPFHIFGGITKELINRTHTYITGGHWHNDNFWTYVPFSLITPYNKPFLASETVYKNWYKMTVPGLTNKIRQAGFASVEIIYLDNAVLSFLLEKILYKTSFYRVTDLNAGFDSLSPCNERKERDALQKVDHVLYTAKELEDFIRRIGKKNKPIFFPNGVDYIHFQKELSKIPFEYEKVNKPIVVYVGLIKKWFDYKLIIELARSRPQINFIIIGEMKKSPFAFDDVPNIHCLGAKPYDDIPAYIRHADVGLIPFNREYNPAFVDCINPLKLYEYMACGLPVVAREWQELKNINSPAYLYRDKDECLACLDKALAEGEARKDEYKAYAKAQGWDMRVKDMLKRLRIC